MQYPAVDTGHWRIGMDSDGFMVIGVLHGQGCPAARVNWSVDRAYGSSLITALSKGRPCLTVHAIQFFEGDGYAAN